MRNVCERNLFRSYIIEFEGKGEKEEKQIKFFATLYVGTEEAIDIIIVSLSMYITHKNTCVYTRHTFTYPRRYMLLSICMRLESFYKYYKGTVIRVHDVYRRVSKEGLITQAPFLRLSSMRKTKECARERENVKECECVCVHVRKWENERVSRVNTVLFWILGSLSLITFQTLSCRVS